jgi:hypothetical protein
MPLEKIAEGINYVVDAYNDNPKIRAAVKTGLIYGAMTVVGEITNNQNLETLVDLAAPITAGIYANLQLNDDEVTTSKAWRTLGKISLATCVGLDISDTITNYTGDQDILNNVKNAYLSLHSYVANNITEIHHEPITGAILSATLAIIFRIESYRQSLREEN